MISFYCKDSPELQIGDDTIAPIQFHQGFLNLDPEDANFPTYLRWINHSANDYGIQNLGVDAEQVPDGQGELCPVCGKSFKTPLALKGHLKSHAPKKA